MKQRPKAQAELHYYSGRLKGKLDNLRAVPTTIVEAPPGYGKTTAIRDHLTGTLPQSTPVYWFAATDELPAICFRRFSNEIGKIDSRAGQRLLQIGLPNAATIGEACDALRSIQCKHEAYLVIDNFQHMLGVLPPSFLAALVEHGGDSLHIVLLTHMLKRNVFAAISGYGFLHITAADLKLEAGDIRRYYSLAGVNVAIEDAKDVAAFTGGWIIAVYLQLRSYRERGAFSGTRDIMALMEHLVWGKLTQEQQDFLLCLSPFETATVQQICALMGCDTLPDYALDALESTFIRYEPFEQRYEPHSILYGLMMQKCRERGEEFQRGCLLRAGDLCRDEGKALEALGFYWRVKDYRRILSLDLSPMILEKAWNTPFSAVALELAENCPVEIKKEYPLSMLRVAWALKIAGMDTAFEALLEGLDATFPEDGLLRAEWLLLSSFRHHPRLREMTAVLRQAEPLFAGACSQVILPSMPWCFSNSGPLGVYHITQGEADQDAAALEEYIALYSQLTGGHGCGADVLFRAELAYQRGELNNAEILAYKAMFLAQGRQQSIIQLGAVLQLAQVALHKSDTAAWQSAVRSMECAAVPSQDSFAFRAALDTMRGILLTELQQLDDIAGWLKEGDFSPQRLLPALVPSALFVHSVFLLHQGEYARLIGITGARYSEGPDSAPIIAMLLSLAKAAAYMQMGDRSHAGAFVRHAAQKALPDGLIFPFASFSWLLKGLTDELMEKEYPALLERFCEIKERFASGWTKLYSDLKPEQMPEALTSREREVALLAAQGLRNSEIAAKLTVTENTVRAHLRTAFQKLDVDRRARLAEKLK